MLLLFRTRLSVSWVNSGGKPNASKFIRGGSRVRADRNPGVCAERVDHSRRRLAGGIEVWIDSIRNADIIRCQL
jgi:hypothetical protein